MRRSKRILATLMLVVISTTTVLAQMPKALKGKWVIDIKATEIYIKASQKWKVKDAKYLRTVMQQMPKVVYEFGDGVLTSSMGDRKYILNVTLTQTKNKKYVFKGYLGEKLFTYTVSITDRGNLIIQSSVTEDMDYYYWNHVLCLKRIDN